MVPATSALLNNGGAGPVKFAARPEGGAWNNNLQLASSEQQEYTFGTSRFEIVLGADNPTNRIQRVLNCGEEYVIFADFSSQRWDIKLRKDYTG